MDTNILNKHLENKSLSDSVVLNNRADNLSKKLEYFGIKKSGNN